MYSLNVPVPGAVAERAWELRRSLTGLSVLRDDHTFVIKRLEARTSGAFAAEERAIRSTIAGTPPFEAQVTGIETFDHPPTGPAPVIYLAVDCPAVETLHQLLVDAFGTVTAVEGTDYVPHITLGRGIDDPAAVEALTTASFDPVTWTVNRLCFWDARREVEIGSVALPA